MKNILNLNLSKKYIFLGYVEVAKYYCLYDIKECLIIKSCDIKFIDYKKINQTKEILDIFNYESLKTKIKFKTKNFTSNF